MALSGLVKRRDPDTVYAWVWRYRQEGLVGLWVRPRWGRKPAFSPSPLRRCGRVGRSVICSLVRPAPTGTRKAAGRLACWRPHLAGSACGHSGVWRVLARLGLRYKRARAQMSSPDEAYAEKLAWMARCLSAARERPEEVVVLYLDEKTFYRRPSFAPAWGEKGRQQPRVPVGYRSNYKARLMAALNVVSGQVHFWQGKQTSILELHAFFQRLVAAYPQAQRIYVVLDNWPVHAHPDVVVTLEQQVYPWWPKLPGNWPQEVRLPYTGHPLPIQLLFLPTYAPWTNPVEKLWRWLEQEVLHLHPFGDDWELSGVGFSSSRATCVRHRTPAGSSPRLALKSAAPTPSGASRTARQGLRHQPRAFSPAAGNPHRNRYTQTLPWVKKPTP